MPSHSPQLNIYVEAVGLAAPGLPSFNAARAVLVGDEPFCALPLEKYKPERLPPNERRRATELVRLAFRGAEDAFAQTPLDPGACATVFASSGGDYPIIDQICRSLTEAEKLVSPTQFHNSVHNSAAGYWSIAVESRLASVSLSAFDTSFAAGLLEAALLVSESQEPCLFACYDLVPPAPLAAKRPIDFECVIALVLTPTPSAQSLTKIALGVGDAPVSHCQNPALAALESGNPAARGLPLVEALARGTTARISLDLNGQNLLVELAPCR